MINKELRVRVRFTEEEANDLDKASELLGYKRSEFIRYCVKSEIKKDSIPKSILTNYKRKILNIVDSDRKLKEIKNDVRKEIEQWK